MHNRFCFGCVLEQWLFRVLADGNSLVHILHLNPNILIFPRFLIRFIFLTNFLYFVWLSGLSFFRWAKIGEITRGNCEYIISLSSSSIIVTVVSLIVETILVFVFLVTSGVSCSEFNLFLPLITKSVMDFCFLVLGLLGLFLWVLGVLTRGTKLLLCGSVPPWLKLLRFEMLV